MGHAEQPTLNIVLVRSRRREVLPVAEAPCRFNPIYGLGHVGRRSAGQAAPGSGAAGG
jgi:hypothetical protein